MIGDPKTHFQTKPKKDRLARTVQERIVSNTRTCKYSIPFWPSHSQSISQNLRVVLLPPEILLHDEKNKKVHESEPVVQNSHTLQNLSGIKNKAGMHDSSRRLLNSNNFVGEEWMEARWPKAKSAQHQAAHLLGYGDAKRQV